MKVDYRGLHRTNFSFSAKNKFHPALVPKIPHAEMYVDISVLFQYDSLSLRCRRLFLPSSHTRDASDLVAAGKSKALSIAVIYNPKSVSIFLFRYLYFAIVPWVIYFSRFPHTPQYQKFKTCSVPHLYQVLWQCRPLVQWFSNFLQWCTPWGI